MIKRENKRVGDNDFASIIYFFGAGKKKKIMADTILETLSKYLLETDEVSNRMESFVNTHCVSFDIADPENFNPDSLMDQKVEWTALHQQFSALLEGEVTSFLTSQGVSNEQFIEECQKEMAKGEGRQNTIFEWLICLSDYKMFVTMMADRQREKK